MFAEISKIILSEQVQTDAITVKVIKKLNRIKQDTIFSSRCLGLKDSLKDVNEVLRYLYRLNAIQLLTDHVYMKSNERPYKLNDDQLIVAVTLCNQVNGHKVQIHGSNACLKFNILVEPYEESFYTTNRSMNMRVINSEIFIYHCPISAVFDHPIKIVREALSALYYLGEENEATTAHIKLIYDAMTEDEFDAFADADKPEWMDKLIWGNQ